jgi:hypothetical protein
MLALLLRSARWRVERFVTLALLAGGRCYKPLVAAGDGRTVTLALLGRGARYDPSVV